MSRDWRLYADDIIEACNKIRRYVQGMSYEEFAGDDRTRDAVLRNLEVIGEAAKQLPPHVTGLAPQIEWRKICGMRDVLAHAYFGVDPRISWSAATTKIDPLEEAVRALLLSAGRE